MKRFLDKKLIQVIDSLEGFRNKYLFIEKPVENTLNLTHLNRLSEDQELDETEKKQFQTHIDALYWGINQKEVYNIALSGGFGTGKSTIISQLIKQKRITNSQTITLGEFGELDKAPKERIEYSILEQLIFAVKAKDVPDSKIERIIETKYIWFRVLGIMLFLYSIIYFFFDTVYSKIPVLPNLWPEEWNHWIWSLVLITGLFLIIWKSYKSIVDYKISKISLTDIELSNSKSYNKKTAPLLNQYYDEILYYFVRTNTRILFIEDLDRFEHSRFIFNKLREINTLLNNSKALKNQKITFVYAIKNCFIGNADQTNKFFELVIPVLPFVSHHTSKNIFLREIKKVESLKEKDVNELEDLISTVSPFIYDVRTIFSIVNDFKITRHKFLQQKKSFDDNELLAFCVYKTILNKDYDELFRGEGIVFNLFQNKRLIQEEKIKTYKEKIKEYEKNIEGSQKEAFSSISELKDFFLGKLLLSLRRGESISDDSLEKMREVEDFEKYYPTSIRINKPYNDFRNENLQDFFRRNNLDYFERKNNIISKNEREINGIRKKIIKNQKEIENIQSKSVKELIGGSSVFFEKAVSITNKNSEDNLKDFNRNEFTILRLLIVDGYINENYHNLLSYQHFDYLDSEADQLYQRIIAGDEPQIDYLLTDIQSRRIIKELRPMHFAKNSSLNFSLIKTLLSESIEYQEKLNLFIGQFENTSEDLEKVFIGIFQQIKFNKNERLTFLISLLKKNSFFLQLEYFGQYENQKLIYSFILNNLDTLRSHIDKTDFEELKDNLKTFIESDESILNTIEHNPNITLGELGYFVYQTQKLENNIKNIVFTQKLFIVNAQNLLDGFELKGIKKPLNLKNIERFYNLYKDNWGDEFKKDLKYIVAALIEQGDVQEDSMNVLDYVFNNDKLEDKLKDDFIANVAFQIKNISEVDFKFWDKLMIWLRLDHLWDNLRIYYEKYNINDVAADFLNENIEDLNDSSFDFTDTKNEEFLIDILKSEEVKNKKLFKSSSGSIKDISFISEDEILLDYLFNIGFIEINRHNYVTAPSGIKLKIIDKYFGEEKEKSLEVLSELNISFIDVADLFSQIENKRAKINIAEYLIENNFSYIDSCHSSNFIHSFIDILKEINPNLLSVELFDILIQSNHLNSDDKIRLGLIFLKEESKTFEEYDKILKGLDFVFGESVVHFKNRELEKSLAEFLYEKGFVKKPKPIVSTPPTTSCAAR